MVIKEIRKRMVEIGEELTEIEKKDTITEEDEIQTDKLVAEFKDLRDKEKKEVEKEEKRTGRKKDIVGLRDHLKKSIDTPLKPEIIAGNGEGEFKNLGEFVRTVRFDETDSRLVESQKRALSFGVDTKGGYLIPVEFIPEIRMVDPAEAIVRPRATVIPAGDIPDQSVEMPALDQTAADGSGIYGGVKVVWVAEGVKKAEADTAFKNIKLDPKEVAAYITLTDKLIRNAPAVTVLITKLFRGAINAAEEEAFFTNALDTRPLGIIPHAGTIAVNRITANRITYGDIVNMLVKSFSTGKYVWIAAKSATAQLMKMKDFEAAESDAPSLIWQPNARGGLPGTILGLPVLFSDLVPALGTKGDLMLAEFSYFLIKDGYGIAIATSEHVHFTENKTVIKAFWNVDSEPWLTAPITLRDAETEVSPFVILDVPAVGS